MPLTVFSHCGGDAFAEEDLRKGEENTAAIERGDREEIHYAKRNAEHTDQAEGPVGRFRRACACRGCGQLPGGWIHLLLLPRQNISKIPLKPTKRASSGAIAP